MEGFGEGVCVAGLLVEEEDAGGFGFGFGLGVGRRRGRRDLGREPGSGEVDAFERVAAVDVPCYILLAARLAAAGPAHLFQAADEFGGELGVGSVEPVAQGGQLGVGDGYGEACVCLLEIGGETELDVSESGISIDDVEFCWDLICAFLEDLHGSWRLGSCETWSAGFHYASLVPCDFLDGLSQHRRVIDSQAGDASDCRFDEYVRAVVFTANAAFDYRSIDMLAHVRVVSHEGQESEVGWFGSKIGRLALGSCGILQPIPCFEEIFGESLLGEGLLIYLDSFTNESEVGRGIKSNLMEQWPRFRSGGAPVLSQDGRDEGTRRTLSLSARYVDKIQPVQIRRLPTVSA